MTCPAWRRHGRQIYGNRLVLEERFDVAGPSIGLDWKTRIGSPFAHGIFVDGNVVMPQLEKPEGVNGRKYATATIGDMAPGFGCIFSRKGRGDLCNRQKRVVARVEQFDLRNIYTSRDVAGSAISGVLPAVNVPPESINQARRRIVDSGENLFFADKQTWAQVDGQFTRWISTGFR